MNDFNLGETFDIKFTSRSFSTGAPTTLAGTPVVSAYEDNSLTQITAGITLTVDFDSLTGLNNVRVVATGANGFERGKSYNLVITTGTVGGVSVVGEVIGSFSIDRERSDVVLISTTIATLASQTSFTLSEGSADNSAYLNQMVIITDQATRLQKALGLVSAYTGGTLTVTLDADPGIFTMAVGDLVDIVAISPSPVALEVDANGRVDVGS